MILILMRMKMKMLETLPTDFCSLPIIIDEGALYGGTTPGATAAATLRWTAQSPSAEGVDPKSDEDETPGKEEEEEEEREEERDDEEDGGDTLLEELADAVLDAAESAWQRFYSSSVNSHVRGFCTSKVRAVCLEVLKRTATTTTTTGDDHDDGSRQITSGGVAFYDEHDDARFLD